MMKSKEEQELEKLEAELKEIKRVLGTVENLEKRKRELTGGRFNKFDNGLIGKCEIAVYDSKLPVYEEVNDYFGNKKIILIADISDKWIILKNKGSNINDVEYYKKNNGRRKGARNDCDSIDFEKAIKIWGDR